MGLEGKLETVGERLNLFTKETGLCLKLKQKTWKHEVNEIKKEKLKHGLWFRVGWNIKLFYTALHQVFRNLFI